MHESLDIKSAMEPTHGDIPSSTVAIILQNRDVPDINLFDATTVGHSGSNAQGTHSQPSTDPCVINCLLSIQLGPLTNHLITRAGVKILFNLSAPGN
jgi:hypothetical protein